MAIGYTYEGKDIATLTAKSKGEIGGGIFPKNSDYKANYSGIYNFIPYRSSGNWAAVRVPYANYFKSESTNSVKISNAAAWGSAPILKLSGLNNISSPYINVTNITLTSTYQLTTDKIGGCTCAAVMVTAKGGAGGSTATGDGGGGGGAGAQAVLIINLNKTGTVTFTPSDTNLTITCAKQSGTITLGNGKNGGKGGPNRGTGGAGGSVSGSISGIDIQWSTTGASGGEGAGGGGSAAGSAYGAAGGNASQSIKFLDIDISYSTYTGGAGGDTPDSVLTRLWGGGGGGASIFGNGGTGGCPPKAYGGAGTDGKPGSFGSGGGGAWSIDGSCGGYGTGGSAYMKIYYESTSTESHSSSSSGGGGLGGCVFPGTQIFLDKNNSIDIVDFKAGTLIDFCNPDTLEHFPQQTLVRLFYTKATRKITLGLEDGKSIALTPNHAVLTKEGFKAYLDDYTFPKYEVGEELATVDGYKKIVSIQDEYIDPTTVYNIITENSLMVANGVIVGGELNYNLDPAGSNGSNIEKGEAGGLENNPLLP